jgi:hypothetical protein
LQAAGLNVTSVQNPLTTLSQAVDAALRALGRQNGPTVLAGHSFSGMIFTETVVYVAARAPDAGEDHTALAKTYPTPPASAGIVVDGDQGRPACKFNSPIWRLETFSPSISRCVFSQIRIGPITVSKTKTPRPAPDNAFRGSI